ncbi:GNAT family N-acetyltransferase [Agarivorans gilvus]|uniref:N-acetyltransferase GCN5 n=1 Tax=Agarivorans gilvus TaxID=680279 RepID=A0ABQ1I864_9ALTE|nr:GNAT family N-acetyltransferase [Agarivorans gilvus]GGB21908.1 N-acetyltransferase GCN5 [Agarivorans gilvus]
MNIKFREAEVRDLERCIAIRGMTRDNPISRENLRLNGVTKEAWEPLLLNGSIIGDVAEFEDEVIAFCFADMATGEVLVLAVLPEYEGNGIAKNLLSKVVEKLFHSGLNKLWLTASSDPDVRAHGFYRHLGWRFSGETDHIEDEVLELRKP